MAMRYTCLGWMIHHQEPSSGALQAHPVSQDHARMRHASSIYIGMGGTCGFVNRNSVTVSGAYGTITFYYGVALPNDMWYGYDYCDSSSTNLKPSTIAAKAAAGVAGASSSS